MKLIARLEFSPKLRYNSVLIKKLQNNFLIFLTCLPKSFAFYYISFSMKDNPTT